MEKSFVAVMRYSLGLGHDWRVDKMLVDEQKQQVDIYISHLGGTFPRFSEKWNTCEYWVRKSHVI